ncbi:hypothetical protein SCB71_06030 [Herbiconiux sp. KACC 21604]|uniref:hypothetical protein n=1 Tax=unclassified Herbiconiux TaxID=2618217 RepID=UPI0014912BCD|nr:hypothetical protein [Herbiconiux sp. SALV-R1]QJU52880.1 hypothetical protein HL652_04015 [Herbiconiux sp. SALV-R1]WPO87800.1 hypothetical protein SCB71_06030 [Herbiconiux sp. KACC 21604]
MRFIFAILAFIIATALIGAGIAQRTVFLPPNTVSSSVSIEGSAPYVMIDSDALRAHDGRQTLELSGSDTIFAAYGRTTDVEAWLDGSSYDSVGYDAETDELVSTVVDANPDGADNVASGSANPAGSDLWLEQFSADGAMFRTLNLPAGYSVIVASDGTQPAPSEVKLSWPIANATPWVGPLLTAGVVFLLAGLVLLVLGLLHMRRSHRPRRKPPALPKGKRFSPSRTNAIESGMKRGRRSIAPLVAAPVVLASVLAVSGCSADYWPQAAEPVATDGATVAATATPDPSATPGSETEPTTAVDDDTPSPAVTEAQLESIVSTISTVTAEADASSNADTLAQRFSGPALELRTATYAIRGGYPEYPAPQAIPSGPLQVALPQASSVWPKTVFTVVQGDDTSVPPVALMLVQETPRSNYKVYYEITLEPDTSLPPVAAASVGTTKLAPDTKLLKMTPDELKTAYADILSVGDSSQYIDLIDPDGDTLRTQVGVDYKNTKKGALPATASLDFAQVAADGQNIALATSGSGALVAVELRESETVKPVESGATVSPEGAVKALSGVTETAKGAEAVYDYQLLFYIPPSGDAGKAELLGFTQGLIQAKELP